MRPADIVLGITIVLSKFIVSNCSSSEIPCLCNEEVQNLPNYTSDQIAEHGSITSRIWVSYRSGVYDITDFVQKHPGGLGPILGGAGGHLEMHWKTIPIHMNERVYAMLEGFRIGNLQVSDRRKYTLEPFAMEKNRSHLMEVIREEPYNAHARPLDLSKTFITPNDLHYVRLHLPIPWIQIEEHSLTISGIAIGSPIGLSMENIKRMFIKNVLNVTLQCSGNRRAEMNKMKLTHGVAYKHTAISTAAWGGVWLFDVIKHFQINTSVLTLKFMNFEGADEDLTGMHYGTSIPIEIAMNPETDLLLAYEMNGEPLPRDHGYPLRLISPGMAGFRSVKFLNKITLSENQLIDVWEQRMYKFYDAKYYWDNIEYDSAPPLYYTNVQSAILIPSDGDIIRAEPNNGLVVKGYAFSGGGNGIYRVDVTIDGGATWVEANIITEQHKSPPRRSWTWVFWQYEIPLGSYSFQNDSKLSLACRAFDTSYNSQPKDMRTIWNMMGVLVNHWHTVNVTVALAVSI